MKSVEQHVRDVLELAKPLDPVETDLLRAHGSVLADPATSPAALPPFDNSSMDGYAVVASDVAGAAPEHPARLPVVADIPAGDTAAHEIGPGQCARIMTGAPLPSGATAVVPVEWTDGATGEVAVTRAARDGNAVRRAGEDVDAGTEVLRAGVRLGAAELAVLAATGCGTVRVHPRPRVVVLSTGEELVEPGRPLGAGQIHESNSFMLTAAVLDAGCAADRYGFIGDEPDTIASTLESVLDRADLVLTTGGVSMGAYDAVKEVLSKRGTVHFEKVAMQPGMPQGFGVLGGAEGTPATPILTLPGNPVSSFVSFHLFVRPLLDRMRGLSPAPPPMVRARLSAPVASSPSGKRSFLRAALAYDSTVEDGGYTVLPATRQGSHQLSALAGANALVVVPEPATELAEGSVVDVLRLPGAS
ncbi:molybdopterin molybdotransferase [Lipingzhangella halophila]|uniref:Molybdopterin molybdenumtransferase n=1 Tax=Lipingzhangella halophila TaxID=1783352 RepID=A0A7W7W097_9ACTN|nr:gephyrin-like molybdotransferase Glp [Lipingzhangella halophila]MBB4929682.1 molybdopterin molybdotransferase [Lipingzhangella halophila]